MLSFVSSNLHYQKTVLNGKSKFLAILYVYQVVSVLHASLFFGCVIFLIFSTIDQQPVELKSYPHDFYLCLVKLVWIEYVNKKKKLMFSLAIFHFANHFEGNTYMWVINILRKLDTTKLRNSEDKYVNYWKVLGDFFKMKQ